MVDQVTSDSSDQFRVDVIDVGQGDSVLLEGPEGSTTLVDSGPYHDHGETVLEHLDERDVDHLDHLVATHYDADHIGGHPEIIEAFGPDRIGTIHGPHIAGVKSPESDTMDRYLDAVEDAGMEVHQLQEGNSLELDGVDIDALNPSQAIESTDRNENSVVLQATHDDQSILLASDVEGEAETRLHQEYPEELDHTDVIKAAHHGSKNGTNSTSLAHTKPESLLISSSLNNQYTSDKNEHDAHPHDEMLKRVHDQDNDVKTYWTPVHGTTSAIVEDEAMQIDPERAQEALSAADVAALKYYGRANDVDTEQLAEIDQIDPADLPDETPKWTCGANIVDTSQTLAEATDHTETKGTAATPSQIAAGSDEELFQEVQAYADEQDASVEDVLQGMLQQATDTEQDATTSSAAEPADSATTTGETSSENTEETMEAGAEGRRILEDLRALSVEEGSGATKSKDTDNQTDEDMGKSL